MSPMNPYYLYKLDEQPDLSNETFLRRQLKVRKANDKGFVFDLIHFSDKFPEKINFVIEKITRNDAVLLSEISFANILNSLAWKSQFAKLPLYVRIKNFSDYEKLRQNLDQENLFFVLQCKTPNDLRLILSDVNNRPMYQQSKLSILPEKYDVKAGRNISSLDYLQIVKEHRETVSKFQNREIPFWNYDVRAHYELEPLVDILWESTTGAQIAQPHLTVIIPTFNNSRFLVNVITHLAEQNAASVLYEVIVVDDGSTDESSDILKKFIQSHNLKINLKFIYWSKKNNSRGEQDFFRPGQARNLAATFARGEFLMFLDSDMLVPADFISSCLRELQTNDLIQFQRYHINQKLSLTNPRINNISLDKDCYVEEKHYWNQLFKCGDWNRLENPWKFVCTYALGIKKQDFFDLGRIRRHFISYGFEDTDLGFRFYKKNKKFKLVQTSLFHLTNYSQMQYQNSDFRRRELLSVTAKIFFLDHLDPEIGTTLKTFLGGEKSLVEKFRNRFLDN